MKQASYEKEWVVIREDHYACEFKKCVIKIPSQMLMKDCYIEDCIIITEFNTFWCDHNTRFQHFNW